MTREEWEELQEWPAPDVGQNTRVTRLGEYQGPPASTAQVDLFRQETQAGVLGLRKESVVIAVPRPAKPAR